MEDFCQIHNEQALFSEQNAQGQMVFKCQFCVKKKLKIENLDEVNDQQKQALQQLQLKFNEKIKQIKDFADCLEQYTQQIQQKLQKIKQLVAQDIQNMIEMQKTVKSMSNGFTNLQQNKINEQEEILNYQLIQIKEQLNKLLKELEKSTKIDYINASLNDLSNEINKKEGQVVDENQMQKIDKKFDYQLIQQSSYNQNEVSGAITFNKDATIMVAGCSNLIKVFEFKDDKIREVQQLNGHSMSVYCLQFMRKSNQFISGSSDSTMIVWEYNQNNFWQSNQVLKGHTCPIYCIIMNQNEDILISGSIDQTIKFWQKQNNTWNSIQSINCQSYVYSISFSEFEDKLVASLHDNQILMLQLQGKEWMIKQKISVQQYGLRLCFISQDQFVFQPRDAQHLLIFDYDSKDQTFKQGQEIQYSYKVNDGYALFPIRYISQIGLILVKHGYLVHLIKRSQKGQFLIEQSINFDTDYLFGNITDDGRYIATGDNKSNQIQTRKFDY